MEDTHQQVEKSLPTDHEHTGTPRKHPLNIRISTFILFVKISIYAIFICSIYYSSHGTLCHPRNTQCNQGNEPSVKSRALVEQGAVHINKFSKIKEYSKSYHMRDDYPTFNEETYFRRDLGAFKSKGDRRTSQPLHNLISNIGSAKKNSSDENRRFFEKGIEDPGTGINTPNVVTKKPARVLEEPVEALEYNAATKKHPDPAIEDPDEETIYFDEEIDEHEEFDEEEKRLRNYLDSYLEDEVLLTNIHKFIQESEDCASKYKQKKYDFFKHIIALRKRFNRTINSIKHRLVKLMTHRRHCRIKLLISTIIRFFSRLLL
ncbi:hypothetical protein C922_04596 [Plasmodium inui San Antonio 1]|uniref:Uncharacterized protein n=1 Tax=Plasmodium inui San Antonio 1 TaxID=1237626 RepID=W7A0A3_9APIC|nr:hypothetical protein C922_04596 [Plasmodium inui San Antonio 1]EUD64968.1 hypothetical protein C922_04596 [Plasmodium inui San Antonio 1]